MEFNTTYKLFTWKCQPGIKCIALTLLLTVVLGSCNKMVQIPQPINTITLAKTFANDANATSAITAIYSDMSFGGNAASIRFSNGLTSLCAGLYADELIDYTYAYPQFQSSVILPDDVNVSGAFWNAAYYDIYMANAVIENLQASTKVSAATKKQLTGEAKFLRAFCYFYLVNLFGDVPLVTITDWNKIKLMSRSPATDIYKQMVEDLQDAQNLLPGDYAITNGEKIRANSWAATALLARVYLFQKNWSGAEDQASAVINSGKFNLLTDLAGVFQMNSDETILQLQTIDAGYYATEEGNNFIPDDPNSSPRFSLTDQLLADFEPGDQRRLTWVDSTNFDGTYYYYPGKYKVKIGTPGSISEYYTLLRYSEQFLIRAEARAQLNKLDQALLDVDTIRSRALLPVLPASLNQSDILTAIAKERRIEFFAEWGHRWFDLKRTGQAGNVLTPLKSGWTSNAELWPIPVSERVRDPNLTQNNGYF